MYWFECRVCGSGWPSDGADVLCCPLCESKDIVMMYKESEGETNG